MDTEITVALIGAAGVCGTIVGTVVGARIQAHGGHAQAQAARDAADTAAKSTQHQALRELRWPALTAYLRAASECMEATEGLHTPSQSRAEVEQAYHAYGLVHAEVELAAPPGMDGVLADMHRVVQGAYHAARTRAPTERALRALDELSQASEPSAVRAKAALARLCASDPPLWDPRRAGDPPPQYAEVIEALYAVPQLDRDQVRLLLANAAVPHEYERNPRDNVRSAREERRQRRNNYRDARRALIVAARNALGTTDP
ncbi:hypothetical protein [Streptomyces sp. DH37]|uniref:hypothetical protein n=1 Tax=Streptomyces sp. DH37 TaxID=3040122 RepID=UPI0024411E4A|nr:hypothetical protein [Streptomyces sp. DH37]MDG9700915.1 hypothetical protein [Streptomyces sp. DH37]